MFDFFSFFFLFPQKANPTTKKKEIVAFFSFYILPSTVMNHATHKDVKAAYSFYNVTTEGVHLIDLMSDALVVAKNVRVHILVTICCCFLGMMIFNFFSFVLSLFADGHGRLQCPQSDGE